MFRKNGLFTCIVLTDCGEEKCFFNVQEINPFMSFLHIGWYLEWEKVTVISQDSGEVVQTFDVDEYVDKGIDFDPDNYISPNSLESWL